MASLTIDGNAGVFSKSTAKPLANSFSLAFMKSFLRCKIDLRIVLLGPSAPHGAIVGKSGMDPEDIRNYTNSYTDCKT